MEWKALEPLEMVDALRSIVSKKVGKGITIDQNLAGEWEAQLVTILRLEMAQARKKFPGNKGLTVALMEEVGELAQAQLQGKSREEIVAEAIQVACVALRIAMEGDGHLLSLGEQERAGNV